MKWMMTGAVLGTLAALSGCGSSGGFIDSGFQTPAGLGSGVFIAHDYDSHSGANLYDAALGAGVAYVVGSDSSGAHGRAGVMPGSDVGADLTSGVARFDTTYALREASALFVRDDTLRGFIGADSGSLTLTADLARGTIRGTDGALEVDARVTGGTMTGTVDYLGDDGVLRGLVGADGVVGAFHGTSETSVFAGGLLGKRR